MLTRKQFLAALATRFDKSPAYMDTLLRRMPEFKPQWVDSPKHLGQRQGWTSQQLKDVGNRIKAEYANKWRLKSLLNKGNNNS